MTSRRFGLVRIVALRVILEFRFELGYQEEEDLRLLCPRVDRVEVTQ